MLLIWGWKTRLKPLGEGVFFSPAAGGDAPYRLVEARRWFTFFWIPIIPLKVLGTFVECQQTGATYDPEILANPTNEALLEQLTAGLRESVALVLSLGDSSSTAQRQAAVAVVREQAGSYDEVTLDHDLAGVATAPIDQRLRHLADALDVNGKERMLSAAAAVMVAGGTIEERQCEAVRSIGEYLGMTPAHISGVLSAASSAITPTDGA